MVAHAGEVACFVVEGYTLELNQLCRIIDEDKYLDKAFRDGYV